MLQNKRGECWNDHAGADPKNVSLHFGDPSMATENRPSQYVHSDAKVVPESLVL